MAKEMITITPCDYKDENGNHHCPYADTYSGYTAEMCRVCCGLGVDDNDYDYEEDYDYE